MSRVTKFLLVVLIVVFLYFVVLPWLEPRPKIEEGTSGVGCVRTINTAEITYASTYPKTGFSPSLAALGGSTRSDFQPNEEHAGLADPNLAAGLKSGCHFTYASVWDEKTHTNIGYTVNADPTPESLEPPTWLERVFHSHPEKKQLHFFSDQSGVVRYEKGREASANSTPLQ